jgi:hypothetical protein
MAATTDPLEQFSARLGVTGSIRGCAQQTCPEAQDERHHGRFVHFYRSRSAIAYRKKWRPFDHV